MNNRLVFLFTFVAVAIASCTTTPSGRIQQYQPAFKDTGTPPPTMAMEREARHKL